MNPLLPKKKSKVAGLITGLCVLGLALVLSMVLGQVSTPVKALVEAFTSYDPSSTEHIIITTTRISRTSIAMFMGASLAVAGALMQALTRNPLASPSIFGINAGALFFVVFATAFFSINSLVQLMWIAFLGWSSNCGIFQFFDPGPAGN